MVKYHTVPVRRDCITGLSQGKVNTVGFVVLNEQILGSRFTFGLIHRVLWHNACIACVRIRTAGANLCLSFMRLRMLVQSYISKETWTWSKSVMYNKVKDTVLMCISVWFSCKLQLWTCSLNLVTYLSILLGLCVYVCVCVCALEKKCNTYDYKDSVECAGPQKRNGESPVFIHWMILEIQLFLLIPIQ